jgi:hypothetical protein
MALQVEELKTLFLQRLAAPTSKLAVTAASAREGGLPVVAAMHSA